MTKISANPERVECLESEIMAKIFDLNFPVFGGRLSVDFTSFRPKTGDAFSLFSPGCVPYPGLLIFDPDGIIFQKNLKQIRNSVRSETISQYQKVSTNIE